MKFIVGLDLGQAQDFTALAVIERVEGGYHVRHLERFPLGTVYPAIVERVAALMEREPLRGQATLVVDATGVGAPVVDLLQAAGLDPVAVTITGGDQVSQVERNHYRVPKRDLVSTLQVLLQSARLKVAESLPEARTLVQELLNFQVRITAAAHDTYGTWREGQHDDLVLATALACWWAVRFGSGLTFEEWLRQEVAQEVAEGPASSGSESEEVGIEWLRRRYGWKPRSVIDRWIEEDKRGE